MLTVQETAIIGLGFRVGQLLDICCPACVDREDESSLLLSAIDSIACAVRAVELEDPSKNEILRITQQQQAVWANYSYLVERHGTAHPFDELLKLSRRLEERLKAQVRADVRATASLMVGLLLGQSSGWYDECFASVCWEYRFHHELENAVAVLGLDVEQASGLPRDVQKFCHDFREENPLLQMYPPNRWGWGFIEAHLTGEIESRPPADLSPPPSGAAPIEPRGVIDDRQPGFLGLILGENGKTPIRRLGWDGVSIDLSQPRLFNLLKKFYDSGDVPVSRETLESDWGRIGTATDPSPNAINDAITALRKCIGPLGVKIVLTTDRRQPSAWRLETIAIPKEFP